MPSLDLMFKGKLIKRYDLYRNRPLTIGRKEPNDVVIDNLGVSGNHARVDAIGNQYTISDLGSTNGTFVNEKLVTDQFLLDKDVILIGKHELIYNADDLDEIGTDDIDYEKTRHLDTSEYKKLIDKARKEFEKKE